MSILSRVWKYQRGNTSIEGGQTAQKKKDKRTNNDLQNTSQKTKDRSIRIPRITRGKLMYSGRVNSDTSDTRRVTLITNPMINHEWSAYDKWNISVVICSIYILSN